MGNWRRGVDTVITYQILTKLPDRLENIKKLLIYVNAA
jgi:hypothetical protein